MCIYVYTHTQHTTNGMICIHSIYGDMCACVLRLCVCVCVFVTNESSSFESLCLCHVRSAITSSCIQLDVLACCTFSCRARKSELRLRVQADSSFAKVT